MLRSVTAPAQPLTDTVRTLTEGSVVALDIGKRKPRTVRVTEVQDTEARFSAYTTSGKTRPGHVSGGVLTADGTGVWFQATMLQSPVRVRAMQVEGLAN